MVRTAAVQSQHILNLVVLLISLAAAVLVPLQTFLFAFAVIGPLHYLTEIAWLRKKDFYYAGGALSPYAFLAVSTLLCGLACLHTNYRTTAWVMAALLALSLGALVRNTRVLAVAAVLLILVKLLLHGIGLFLAAFVPAIALVCLFTLLFLVSGARRSARSTFCWVNAGLLVLLPIGLLLMSNRLSDTTPGRYWMTSETLLAPVHEYLAGLIGMGLHFDPDGALHPQATAIFRVLGFIYLHHYLKWFARPS